MNKQKKDFNSMSNKEKKEYINKREAQQKKKKKIIKAISLIAGASIIVGLIGASKYSINHLKDQTVAKYEDHEISKKDYNFYYNLYINEWLSTRYDYLNYYGLDLSKDFSIQVYDEETNMTWYDFFISETDKFIERIILLNEEAEKNDFSDYSNEYNSLIKNAKKIAENNNLSYIDYIHSKYGDDITEEDFEKMMKKYSICISYSNKVSEDFKNQIPMKDVDEYYNSNANDYDSVFYKLIELSVEDSGDFDENEIKELEKQSTEILNNIKTEEDFDNQAEKLNKNKCDYVITGINNVDETYSEWLYNKSRKNGDTVLLSNKDNSCYYILYFKERKLIQTKTVNFRYVYKEIDEKTSMEEAKLVIDNMVDEFIRSNGTENEFIEIVEKNNVINGGLQQNIVYDTLDNKEIADWLWDENRNYKDNKVFIDNNSVYFVYYIKDGEAYYSEAIKNILYSEKYNEWYSDLEKDKELIYIK